MAKEAKADILIIGADTESLQQWRESLSSVDERMKLIVTTADVDAVQYANLIVAFVTGESCESIIKAIRTRFPHAPCVWAPEQDDGLPDRLGRREIDVLISSGLDLNARRAMLGAIVQPLAEQHRIANPAYCENANEVNQTLKDNIKQMRSFVGIVAHDLRAPLGKLINISEVLISGVDEDEVETFYKLMYRTSKRAFDLVNDILDLTAVESGQVQLDLNPTDIWSLGIQIMSELSYLAGEKEIRLINNIQDSIEVRADARRLFQVLVNLITNAVKFTPRKGTVTLDAETKGQELMVSITDTGVGIPSDVMPHLFAKHHKFSTPGTDGERGTGYGLSLSQELIRAHGSRIEVESKEGIGSVFHFNLPLWPRQKD